MESTWQLDARATDTRTLRDSMVQPCTSLKCIGWEGFGDVGTQANTLYPHTELTSTLRGRLTEQLFAQGKDVVG